MPNTAQIKQFLQKITESFGNFLKKEADIRTEAEKTLLTKVRENDEDKIQDIKKKINNI